MKKLILWICTTVLAGQLLAVTAAAKDYKFNMSYIYFGKTSSYTKLVDSTKNSLNEVAPNYFNLNPDGSLHVTGAASRTFVDEMHARGIKVVPYLTNDWNRQTGINALDSQASLAADLAKAIQDYNLDGVNVDLENLTHNQRTAYVDFVRLLRETLPAGKTIAVAVAANPNGYKTGWQGSYDYAGLAEYSDYLMIMAYDEHWDGSEPGPVSSIQFVEKSVKYALSLVPKEKIVLGLPFYGRVWSDSGSFPNGYGLSYTKVEPLLSQYGGTVGLDAASISAKATFTVDAADTKPVVGGKQLSAGSYTIWYDNEQTLKAKLSLVQKYDLKGTGTWSLGQETAATWDYYRLWLNGCSFADIQDSWAKDYILTAYMNKLVTGVSAESFAPNEALTRAQAAAMLVRTLGYPLEAGTGDGFTDIQGSWAESYINTARKHKLVSGVGENRFDPDRAVTRQEIAVMLNNILGHTPSGRAAAYNDVSPEANAWSYDAIAALSEQSVITGYTDGSYRPLSNVSRAEMTVLLTRIQ